jgi:undecaprenyl-diphosphatase
MNNFSSILLGIVQGATEFLPISSSGHLVLFQNLLGFRGPELLLDCALHLGTLFAVCVYFRTDLQNMIKETIQFIIGLSQRQIKLKALSYRPYASLTLWVVIGTLPTVIIALLFRPSLENLFGSVTAVGVMLVMTGMILAITWWIPEHYGRRERVGLFIALAVGTAQGIALIPGISRSGTTIVCALLCGVRRDLAARFSFLLSIPAIIGAVTMQLATEGLGKERLLPLISGFLVSALVGFFALKVLMGMVKRGNLSYLAPYCWALGLFIIFFT